VSRKKDVRSFRSPTDSLTLVVNLFSRSGAVATPGVVAWGRKFFLSFLLSPDPFRLNEGLGYHAPVKLHSTNWWALIWVLVNYRDGKLPVFKYLLNHMAARQRTPMWKGPFTFHMGDPEIRSLKTVDTKRLNRWKQNFVGLITSPIPRKAPILVAISCTVAPPYTGAKYNVRVLFSFFISRLILRRTHNRYGTSKKDA
jgi:hypothetical protein